VLRALLPNPKFQQDVGALVKALSFFGHDERALALQRRMEVHVAVMQSSVSLLVPAKQQMEREAYERFLQQERQRRVDELLANGEDVSSSALKEPKNPSTLEVVDDPTKLIVNVNWQSALFERIKQ
jgi:hypothetical protein